MCVRERGGVRASMNILKYFLTWQESTLVSSTPDCVYLKGVCANYFLPYFNVYFESAISSKLLNIF